MSSLKAFQERTVERALSALTDPTHSRRFLIADEVGLGKTIVARELVRRMAAHCRTHADRPLRVFYLCSNLSIAHQNRDRILEAGGGVSTEVDRLTLVPARKQLPDRALFHLYTLTAATSFPDRKGRSRGGTWEERALVHNLLRRIHKPTVRTDWLRRGVEKKNWPGYTERDSVQPTRALVADYRRVLLARWGLERASQVNAAVRARRGGTNQTLSLIGELRTMLAHLALETVAPDLVIFDEFQRFRDLMQPREADNAAKVAQLLLEPDTGDRPAVLLLSATPYKLFDSHFEDAFGDQPHHRQLLDLYGWLAGGGTAGKTAKGELETAFRRFGDALRAQPMSEETRQARALLEARMRPHIARTERYRHAAGQAGTPPPRGLSAPLHAADLDSFKHAAACLAPVEGERSYQWSAVPYWRSVPLPMQTMGPHYKPWKTARDGGRLRPAPAHVGLTEAQRHAFEGPPVWAHPQLRAMAAHLPAETLSLPWVAPSRTWWPMGGPWATGSPRKALLFSRFVAVPRAVATFLSYDVERWLLHGRLQATHADQDVYASVTSTRRPFHFSVDNIALFHPSRLLVDLVDPRPGDDPTLLRERARAALLAKLAGKVRVSAGAPDVEYHWQLIGRLEQRLSLFGDSHRAWMDLADRVSSGKGRTDEYSLAAKVSIWARDATTEGPGLVAISARDLDVLVEAAVGHPAVVLARALSRHWAAWNRTAEDVGEDMAPYSRVIETSWRGLRAYLNNAWFEERLRRAYGAPDPAEARRTSSYGLHVQKAVIDGNLESVLDEHLFMTGRLRGLEGHALCKALERALSLRVTTPRLHEPGTKGFTLRAHAVMPFSQSVSVARVGSEGEEKEQSVRADELRESFNSPFWPHVLVTTSIGQEGLDFHVWCDTVMHWDLPGNPVDLEQREGRVNRYGGLAVRRAMARLDVRKHCDTWAELADAVDELEDETGLSPWWVLEGAHVERRVFDVPLSEAKRHFAHLEEQRMLYRLALGQPDQEGLVRALRGRIDEAMVRELAIDLG